MKNAIHFLLLSLIIFTSFSCMDKKGKKKTNENPKAIYSYEEHLKGNVTEMKGFLRKEPKYNSEIAFFIDMKVESGKNRFFVYDLKNDKIANKGLVAHGIGSETEVEGQLKFSNVKDSKSSSLGKYVIGSSYSGSYGKAYKLYGLDKTNSNAFDRNIVLHKYSKVPFDEQPYPICYSLGCPMVNEKFFGTLEKAIDNSKKKIILVLYY
ncbi:murein L,D-transpeptidase catalytic domain-containing protein [Flavobacterium procerum]|uniref:Murein L,D-transpeptidase catalytic domain-containing protein n=1 Tax=Flavobacterium procerum TaxID=1455569 RepID=A0ABV6BLC3_9FLAO